MSQHIQQPALLGRIIMVVLCLICFTFVATVTYLFAEPLYQTFIAPVFRAIVNWGSSIEASVRKIISLV